MKLSRLLFFVSTAVSPVICSPILGQSSSRPDAFDDPMTIVYRGDPRSPDLIKADGGFRTRNQPKAALAFGIQNHVDKHDPTIDTAYISTTEKKELSFDFATKHGSGFVYKVHITPNAIDINRSYRESGKVNKMYFMEREQAFLGGIGWNQVKGWYEATEKKGKVSLGKFNKNKEYINQFDKFRGAGAQPQLFAAKPDNPNSLQEEAIKLMSNTENTEARAVGGKLYAPSFCGIGGVATSPECSTIQGDEPSESASAETDDNLSEIADLVGDLALETASDFAVGFATGVAVGAVSGPAAPVVGTILGTAKGVFSCIRKSKKILMLAQKVGGLFRKSEKAARHIGVSSRKFHEATKKVESVLEKTKMPSAGSSKTVGEVVKKLKNIPAQSSSPNAPVQSVQEAMKRLEELKVPTHDPDKSAAIDEALRTLDKLKTPKTKPGASAELVPESAQRRKRQEALPSLADKESALKELVESLKSTSVPSDPTAREKILDKALVVLEQGVSDAQDDVEESDTAADVFLGGLSLLSAESLAVDDSMGFL